MGNKQSAESADMVSGGWRHSRPSNALDSSGAHPEEEQQKKGSYMCRNSTRVSNGIYRRVSRIYTVKCTFVDLKSSGHHVQEQGGDSKIIWKILM